MAAGGAGGDLNLTAGANLPSGGAGYGGLGVPGNVNITGSYGYNSVGGAVNITAGATSCWSLVSGSHSDINLKGGTNLATTDAASIVVQGGYTIGTSCPPPGATGGNLLLTAGIASGTGTNGYIKLDGVVAYGITSITLIGGASGSPASLLNQKSYVGLLPADATNNYYQLPSPVSYPGRMYIIRNNSSSFNANITTAAGLLFAGNSSTSTTPYTLSPTASPKTIMAVSDGANWTIMKQD